MHVALLALILLAAALLAAATVVGITLEGSESLLLHWKLGLSATILTCFVHCLAMFYLIGTGKDIRDAVEEDEALRAKFWPLTRELKRRVFPPATLAAGLTIFAALMGGEVHSRIIRPEPEEHLLRDVTGWWFHALCVTVALAVNLWAFLAELRAARDNRRAILEINDALETAGEASDGDA